MNDKNLVIELSKAQKKYYVAIKSHDQIKQVIPCSRKEETYRQILRFVMGYLTGYSERMPLSYDKLNTMVITFNLVFEINVKFLTI